MTKRAALAIAAILAVGVAGCGSSSSPSSTTKTQAADPNAVEVSPAGDIPDNQAFVAFSPSGGGFSVKVPEGWSRTSSGGAVTFTDKLNAVRIEFGVSTVPLTVREAKQGEVPGLHNAVPGFTLGEVGSVTRKAGTAVRITYLADAKPNEVTGKTGQDAVERYVFFHKGKQVILTLSGPKGADNVDPWKIITDSLRWTR
jgi:hypothetical protein